MKEPRIIEVFTDNGEHSHWKLINTENGETLWEEREERGFVIRKEEAQKGTPFEEEETKASSNP